jgi:Tfp pilus assembly PilM family ATPase
VANVAVGIEINARAMRVVQARRGRRGVMLEGSAMAFFPPGMVTPGGVQDPEAFREIAVEVLERANAERINLSISVSSERADIRQMQLPRMSDRDMHQAIRQELERLVLYQDDFLLDYQVLVEDAETKLCEVLVVSIPKNLVYSIVSPLRSAGYHPEIIDVGGFSLPLACPSDGGTGYLLLGPDLVHMLFFQGSEYRLSRLVPLPLGELFEGAKIGDPLVATAQDDAAGRGGASAGGMSHPVIRALCSTVTQTLEGAQSIGDTQVLIISGEGAQIEGMAKWIEDETGIPTVRAAPLIGSGEESHIEEEGAAYAVAVGMAHRGVTEL